MFRKKTHTYLALMFLFAGALLVTKSGYFYAKGALAQILLDHAWAKSRRTKEITKAWSWADTHPIGKLSIPSIHLSRVVLEYVNNGSLAFGPAHVSVSAEPGEHGNIAIAGHRDSFFKKLGQVKIGDKVELESLNTVQSFVVTDIQITKPEDTEWVEDSLNDVITLITCYPFDFAGPAPKRYVVRGELM